jgi:hypothetical protein
MSVMIAAKCNKCGYLYDNIWVNRDNKGLPTTEGLVCVGCNSRNCLSRDWAGQEIQAIIPPLEDGNINRFEYSYNDENGKRKTKKMDPKMVQKHFENQGRK